MTDARAVLDGAMTEAELTEAVIEAAQRLGWLAFHVDDGLYRVAAKEERFDVMGEPDFPDLILVHPGHQRLIVVELKRARKHPTPGQREWLDAFRAVAHRTWQLGYEPVVVRVWRPSDWSSGAILAILTGENDTI